MLNVQMKQPPNYLAKAGFLVNHDPRLKSRGNQAVAIEILLPELLVIISYFKFVNDSLARPFKAGMNASPCIGFSQIAFAKTKTEMTGYNFAIQYC